MKIKFLLSVLFFMFLLCSTGFGETAEQMYENAYFLENGKNNAQKAKEIYLQIAQEPVTGQNKDVVQKSLIRLAILAQQANDPDTAKSYYQRLVNELGCSPGKTEIEIFYSGVSDPETKNFIAGTPLFLAQERKYFSEIYFDSYDEDRLKESVSSWMDIIKEATNFEPTPEQEMAIESLGALHYTPAVPDLLKVATNSRVVDNQARWAAVRALGRIGDKSVVPALIDLVNYYNLDTKYWARASLFRLTKTYFAGDIDKWAAWWNENGSEPKYIPGRKYPALQDAIDYWNKQKSEKSVTDIIGSFDKIDSPVKGNNPEKSENNPIVKGLEEKKINLNSFLTNKLVAKYHREGLKAYYNIDNQTASEYFKKALALEPGNMLIKFRLWGVYNIIGTGARYENDATYSLFRKKILNSSTIKFSDKLLYDVVNSDGDFENNLNSLTRFEKSISEEDVMLEVERIIAFVYVKQYDKALELIDYLIKKYPGYPVLYSDKYVIYRFQGKFVDCERVLNEAIKLLPANNELQYDRNYTRFLLKKNKESLAASLQQTKKWENPLPYYLVIMNYIELKDYKKAEQFIAEGEKRYPWAYYFGQLKRQIKNN